ncbi:MAG: hypothetical protein KHX03_09995 [Clostridium sp.]|nr:hypothetical protein [Clostridium sp.]
MSINPAGDAKNNRGGNGQFRPLLRRAQQENKLQANLAIIDKKDIRMRFKNSRDPLYIAFDYIDKRPVQELAVEFVKDSLFDIVNFISGGNI